MTLPTLTYLIYVVIIACTVAFYVLTRGEFYLDLRPATLLVPVALVMLVVFAWASALWFSPLAPRARDVRRLAAYVIGFWYFLTPVMYPIDEIPSELSVPREPQPGHGADRDGQERPAQRRRRDDARPRDIR